MKDDKSSVDIISEESKPKKRMAMDILNDVENPEPSKMTTETFNGRTFNYGNKLEKRLTEDVLKTSLSEAKSELQSNERAVEIIQDEFTGSRVINVMSDKVIMRDDGGRVLKIVDNLEDIKKRAKRASEKKNGGIKSAKGNAGAYNPTIEDDIEFE